MADEKSETHGARGSEPGGGEHGGHKRAVHLPHGGAHEEAHEGAPEWLISFADNVTLIMGFFVIMLAFFMKGAGASSGGPKASEGTTNEAAAVSPEVLDWVIGVRAGFNNPVDINSNDPRDQLLVQRLRVRTGRGPATDPGPHGRHEETQILRPSDYYGLGGVVPFDAGGHELSPAAHEKLANIAQHLLGFRSVVEVRGHVSLAEARNLANNGVDLSYTRALVVAHALAEAGVDWPRLRLIACGASEPLVAPAYDDAGQRSNQRVEVVVTNHVSPLETPPTPALSPAEER